LYREGWYHSGAGLFGQVGELPGIVQNLVFHYHLGVLQSVFELLLPVVLNVVFPNLGADAEKAVVFVHHLLDVQGGSGFQPFDEQGIVHDPDLEGHIITVPEVRMSPDLKLATIYVMPLGGRDIEIVIAALERNRKFLRGEIAHRVNLKFAPDVRIRADDRFDEAERIEKLLRTPAVQKDLAPDSQDSEE